MIFYAGDTHGRIDDVKDIEKEAVKAGAKIVVQVGDFGIHFGKDCELLEWFNTRSGGLPWITCGGLRWDLASIARRPRQPANW